MEIVIRTGVNQVRETVNDCFKSKEPWQILAMSATGTFFVLRFYDFIYRYDESAWERCKKFAFRLLRKIPSVHQKVEKELNSAKESFYRDVEKRCSAKPFITSLPLEGTSHDIILKDMKDYLNLGDYSWKDGFVSGAVYLWDPKLLSLLKEVYGATSYTNPLHPDVFPGINKMEAEVIRICCNLFNGSADSCGTMTSGGTESIMMACKAYRDYARDKRGISRPEIIVPVTAHAAFDKAALYLGMRIKHVSLNEDTTVDMKAMKQAISSETCMLVGSAPNFPYGTMDDIQSIAKLGQQYNIPVHIDACLGGFVAVFMNKAGYDIAPFDFRVKGVTSISADTHKYGFTPKGSSVVLYSSPEFRRYQYTVTTDWPGGVYGSPTMSGSRAGGIIATCWATLMHFGMEGYVKATQQIISTAREIEKKMRDIPEICVLGQPVTTVIAMGSKVFDVYRLQEALQSKGWNLNTLQFPRSIHICVTHIHTSEGTVNRFVKDVRDAVQDIMKNPDQRLDGKMAIYGAAQTVSDRSIVGDITRYWIDSLYHTA